MKRSLLTRTQQALALDDRPLIEISRLSGLSYAWLKKFKADQIPNPGVRTLEKLLDVLLRDE